MIPVGTASKHVETASFISLNVTTETWTLKMVVILTAKYKPDSFAFTVIKVHPAFVHTMDK
jgi:hypothetical protein